MRLLVKKNGLYTYPDVMVECGKLQFVKSRTDTLTNPVVDCRSFVGGNPGV
jgi:hypothetical protein